MSLTDQAKTEIRSYLKDELLRIFRNWGMLIGTTNLIVIVSSLVYVFFILPGSAVQEAKSQINTEIKGIKDNIIQQSSDALISVGKVNGSIDQVKENIEPLNQKYSDALQELNLVRKDIKTLLNPAQKDSAKILRQLEKSPKAEEILSKLSEIQLNFGERIAKGCSNPKSGEKNDCRCPEGSVLVGIVREDKSGDSTDAEKVIEIICQKISLK